MALEKTNIIILGAGMGSRMKSKLPKVLHKVAGKTLMDHLLSSIEKIEIPVNVLSVLSQDILDNFSAQLPKSRYRNYVVQEKRLGTGHATMCAVEDKNFCTTYKYTGIFYADVPFVEPETIQKLYKLQERYDLVVLCFEAADQSQKYGRMYIKRNHLPVGDFGRLKEIREFIDIEGEKPKLCNSGIMFGKTEIFMKLLSKIQNKNKAKEYYLTDIIALANKAKYRVATLRCEESEMLGINSQEELANAEMIYQKKLKKKFFNNGVSFIMPDTIYLSHDTEIGTGTTIEPHVFLGTGVKVGENCHIRAGSYLEDTTLESNSNFGPMSRGRGGAVIGEGVHVGNFAEIKNSTVGKGTKIGHVSYTGDATLGENVNIGAGMIICNYDGVKKYHTDIGNSAFVGSNTTIISPCKIDDDTFIAGGSTITKHVAQYELAVGRAKQENIEGWVKKRKVVEKDGKQKSTGKKEKEK